MNVKLEYDHIRPTIFRKNLKKLSLCSYFLCFTSALLAQTYVSPQQKTTTNGFTNRVETKLVKKVVLDGTTFILDLPEVGQLNGAMTLFKTIEREEEKRTIYTIEVMVF